MNIDIFYQLCRDFGFPTEACNYLSENYEKIKKSPPAYSILTHAARMYANGEPFSFWDEQNGFENACTGISVHPYPAQMIFYLYLCPILERKYKEKGLPDEMFSGVGKGIKCKLDECYNVYGIYGSFVAIWFSRFFNFSLFAIGRLELAPFSSDFDYKTISQGDPLIDVHIPSRGKLDHQEVLDSYSAGLEFFCKYFNKDYKGFICESWLLYPPNATVIPECKNIVSFMNDYQIVKWHHDPSNDDLWRIFNSSALSYPNAPLDCNTYMQKQYAKHLNNGGSMGIGIGLRIL